MPSSTAWSRKLRSPARPNSAARRLAAGILLAAICVCGAAPRGGSATGLSAVPSGNAAGVEYLSDVLRDFRKAKLAGPVAAQARLVFAERAFAVADVARGRERYEALRFVAGLDAALDSPALLAARDRALERVAREFQDDGDLMGEFVLRVLRRDEHDRALCAKIEAATQSDAVRAACLLRDVEPLLDRALDDGDVTASERDTVLQVLARILERHGAAKHPLSARTWGEVAAECSVAVGNVVLVGERAPEIRGLDLDGEELRLSSLRGKAVLVCFWGEWCAPCRALHGRLRGLRARFPEREFAILGVNSDPQRASLVAAAARESLAWPNLWDGPDGTAGPIATRWRVRAWPTWYLVDGEGLVRRRWRGAPEAEDLDAALKQWVSRAR
jgi:peroxiredoxin